MNIKKIIIGTTAVFSLYGIFKYWQRLEDARRTRQNEAIEELLSNFSHVKGRFGVEFEFLCSQTKNELLQEFTKNGIPCTLEDSDDYSQWKILEDKSIKATENLGHTFEVVSRILEGDVLREVAKVLTICDDFGCKVNQSAGFHVHYDPREFIEFPTW